MTEGVAAARKPLLASRVLEQGILGLGALALARAAGVDAFAPLSVVLIVNSLAVTLADLGLGTDVLRLGPGQTAALHRLHRVRITNLGLAVVGLAAAAVLSGSSADVAFATALIWPAAAEAYVRKSGALRQHAVRSVVLSEVVGSFALALGILAACAHPTSAMELLTAGLVAKSVLEAALARAWQSCFSTTGVPGDQLALWLAQVAAYAITNVDFLIVGVFLGGRAFSVYALAFRLSGALPSQLAYVAGRTASVDLASRPDDQQAVYLRYLRPLFVSGALAMLLTALAAPLVPWVLGDDWSAITWVLVVLSVGVPWRMVLGVGGTLLIVARRSDLLLRTELCHLVLFAAALVLAAAGVGYGAAVGVVAAASVLAVLAYHRVATGIAGIRWWSPLVPLAVVSMLLIAGLATQVTVP